MILSLDRDSNCCGVSAAHFVTGVLGCEHPVDACTCSIALSFPGSDFKIEKGGDQLSDYTWIPPGKSEANLHYRFCETCGVRVFAQGNKASAGGKFYAVAIAALDDIEQDADQVAKSIKYVDGRHDDYGHKPADTRLL